MFSCLRLLLPSSSFFFPRCAWLAARSRSIPCFFVRVGDESDVGLTLLLSRRCATDSCNTVPLSHAFIPTQRSLSTLCAYMMHRAFFPSSFPTLILSFAKPACPANRLFPQLAFRASVSLGAEQDSSWFRCFWLIHPFSISSFAWLFALLDDREAGQCDNHVKTQGSSFFHFFGSSLPPRCCESGFPFL